MQKITPTLLFLGAMLFLNAAFAQVLPDTTKNTDPSLNGQYQFMLKKSKTLSGAKLINPSRLTSLWKSVSDTLRKERKQLQEAKLEIKTQSQNISSLKGEVSTVDGSISFIDFGARLGPT